LLEGQTRTLPKETVIISASNNQIPVAVSASPIKNYKGVIIGGIVVFRDISREIELDEMRSDLMSIASHQLRTPISEIKGLSELLLDNVAGPLNEKQQEYLKLLKFANDRMINLVNDLLNISRLEQGRLQFQFGVYDLGALTQEVYNGLKIRAAEKSQNFFLTIDSGTSHLVYVDQDKTKEIISNLLENALKYTFAGGTIQARVTTNEEGVWFLVKDTGVGIPREKQKDLFKKFSRIENPLSKTTTGTGLGLYTVKQMVERQSGRIQFQTEENKGSTFAIKFPFAKS
jgi:signal transduction histidine kinase